MLELKICGADEAMGWLDFIASIVSSVAWPIAAVVIALAFRKQISGLLNKIRRLSWGDTSVELAEKLDKVETVSQSIPILDHNPDPALPTDRFQRLLEISPAAAILDSWTNVEGLLRDIGNRRGYDSKLSSLPSEVAHRLQKENLISDSVYEMVRDLRGIRNEAAHKRDVTPTDAYRFYELVERVTKALDKLT